MSKKNITRLLGNISIEKNLPLDYVVKVYCDYYRDFTDEHLDEPITLEYSEDIYLLTKKYYDNLPIEDEIVSKWKREGRESILYNYKGGNLR